MLAPAAALATPTQTYLNPANALVSQQVTIDAVNFIDLDSSSAFYPYTPSRRSIL